MTCSAIFAALAIIGLIVIALIAFVSGLCVGCYSTASKLEEDR